MTFSCVVLPAELISRELDAAKSTVARFEHLNHLLFCKLSTTAMHDTTSPGTCGWKRLSIPSLKPGGAADSECTFALICFDLQENGSTNSTSSEQKTNRSNQLLSQKVLYSTGISCKVTMTNDHGHGLDDLTKVI